LTCLRPRSLSAVCRASDKCQREKRKTINGDDLLWAMATLGFEDYIEPLKVYLQKYREVRTDEGIGDFRLIGLIWWSGCAITNLSPCRLYL
jgi:hypothetical protein